MGSRSSGTPGPWWRTVSTVRASLTTISVSTGAPPGELADSVANNVFDGSLQKFGIVEGVDVFRGIHLYMTTTLLRF
ncbi:MAG TPA: hypothetical protein VNY05_31805 [Candidatus Acidoferrales bacterium]|nr:hypothetical protein [Candidatus Acidoferrales bacterium]